MILPVSVAADKEEVLLIKSVRFHKLEELISFIFKSTDVAMVVSFSKVVGPDHWSRRNQYFKLCVAFN